MKTTRFVSALILILVCLMTISGCASVEYIRIVDGTNAIIDKLVIELDESKINKTSKSVDEIIDVIESDMVTLRNSITEWKEQFRLIGDIYAEVTAGITVDIASSAKNQIAMTVKFGSARLFALFYGNLQLDETEYSKALSDVGPFVTKIIDTKYEPTEYYGMFLYKYSMIKDTGIVSDMQNLEINGENCMDKYRELTNNWYDENDLDISQIFVYPDSRIYSNADEKDVQLGMTFLKWNFADKPEDFEMSIFKIAPRSTNWYGVALVVSIVSIIIIAIVIAIQNKNGITVKITKDDVEKKSK